MSDPNIILITPRKSPEDYIDGYQAALEWVEGAITMEFCTGAASFVSVQEKIERQILMIKAVKKFEATTREENKS